jgi:predicted ester cyclase
MSPAQNWAYLEGFRTAFPDLHFDVTLTVAQADYVVAHWRASGTHSGPLPTPAGDTVPATGKNVVVHGSATYELRGSKIYREYVFWDMTSLLGQLGLMPS